MNKRARRSLKAEASEFQLKERVSAIADSVTTKTREDDGASALKLAELAVLIAMWKGYSHPAFIDAERVLEDAHQHLSGERQIRSPREYQMELDRVLRPNPTTHIPSVADPIDVIEQTLRDEDSHPAVAEPNNYPALRSTCLHLITGEKDRKRRAPWLLKAGIQESGNKINSPQDFRALACQLIRHVPKFGAKYPRQRRTSPPRGGHGRFEKANVQRDAQGRVKKITRRDEKGQIRRNLTPS